MPPIKPRMRARPKPVKAYKNARFLMGEDARPIRLMAEYLEPMTRLRRHKVKKAIIFFGSARIRPSPKRGPDYFKLASDLAEKLAAWTVRKHTPARRYRFCTGGGPGMMEAAAGGVARVDRKLNIALNISLPFEQSVNEHVTPELVFEFHYFFMRKFWFMKLAEALIVFPGGFGTLDELFEVLTLVQTRKSRLIPIVLFGTEFWREVVNFDALVRRGVVSPEDLDLFCVTDTVDVAFRHITRGL